MGRLKIHFSFFQRVEVHTVTRVGCPDHPVNLDISSTVRNRQVEVGVAGCRVALPVAGFEVIDLVDFSGSREFGCA